LWKQKISELRLLFFATSIIKMDQFHKCRITMFWLRICDVIFVSILYVTLRTRIVWEPCFCTCLAIQFDCHHGNWFCNYGMCRVAFITFFKCGLANPSQQCKRASNNIQDPPPRWILTIFKLKFGGGNLFSPTMTSTIEGNNFVGSLLKPLLKKVIPVVGSRMLCSLLC
jgi:hypothetical protein